jgi:IstB-like ATP binding protein
VSTRKPGASPSAGSAGAVSSSSRLGTTASSLRKASTASFIWFAFQPDLDVVRIKELATLRFVEHKANAILLGPLDTSKTHLAVALAIAACQRRFSIYFTTLDDLVQQLKTAEHRNQLQHKLKTYLKPALLVVDEVGYLRLDRTEANDFLCSGRNGPDRGGGSILQRERPVDPAIIVQGRTTPWGNLRVRWPTHPTLILSRREVSGTRVYCQGVDSKVS